MNHRNHPFSPGVVIRCRPVRRISPAQRGLLLILAVTALLVSAAAWPWIQGLLR